MGYGRRKRGLKYAQNDDPQATEDCVEGWQSDSYNFYRLEDPCASATTMLNTGVRE